MQNGEINQPEADARPNYSSAHIKKFEFDMNQVNYNNQSIKFDGHKTQELQNAHTPPQFGMGFQQFPKGNMVQARQLKRPESNKKVITDKGSITLTNKSDSQ